MDCVSGNGQTYLITGRPEQSWASISPFWCLPKTLVFSFESLLKSWVPTSNHPEWKRRPDPKTKQHMPEINMLCIIKGWKNMITCKLMQKCLFRFLSSSIHLDHDVEKLGFQPNNLAELIFSQTTWLRFLCPCNSSAFTFSQEKKILLSANLLFWLRSK